MKQITKYQSLHGFTLTSCTIILILKCQGCAEWLCTNETNKVFLLYVWIKLAYCGVENVILNSTN